MPEYVTRVRPGSTTVRVQRPGGTTRVRTRLANSSTSAGASGAAGGFLQGSYPNPEVNPSELATEVDALIEAGDGIVKVLNPGPGVGLPSLTLSTTAALPWSAAALAPHLAVVAQREVLSNTERVTAGFGDGWLDGTAGIHQGPDGSVYLFSCEFDRPNNVTRTTISGDFAEIIGDITRADVTGVPAGATALGGKVYHDEANDQLLMVTHTNRDGVDGGLWSCVGLSKSTDWGESWAYLGDIITPNISIDHPGGVGSNVIGSFSPYTISGDYLYVFHADQLDDETLVQQTVSRCLLTDVLADAADDTVGTGWRKWDGTGWTELGLGGAPAELSGLNAGVEPIDFVNHVDVLWIEQLDRFLMLVSKTDGTLFGSEHWVSSSATPEGPWSTPVALRDPVDRSEVFCTLYGGDPQEPWVARSNTVQILQLATAEFGVFDDFSVDVIDCVPYVAPQTVSRDGLQTAATYPPGTTDLAGLPAGTVVVTDGTDPIVLPPVDDAVGGNWVIYNATLGGTPGPVTVTTAPGDLPANGVGDVTIPVGSIAVCAPLSPVWIVVPVAVGGSPAAADVSYDGTDSGLVATDLQAAIDETVGLVEAVASEWTELARFTTASANDWPTFTSVPNRDRYRLRWYRSPTAAHAGWGGLTRNLLLTFDGDTTSGNYFNATTSATAISIPALPQGGGGHGELELLRTRFTTTIYGLVGESNSAQAPGTGAGNRTVSAHSYRLAAGGVPALSTWALAASNNDVWAAGWTFILEGADLP